MTATAAAGDVIKEFGPGDGGTHIMFHDGWLYHSSRTAVYRYKYTPGELVPTGELQTVIHDLPAEKDHDAKAFAFDDQGRIIVEVGSPFNVYSDGDRRLGAKGKTQAEIDEFQKTYGGFWRYDANKLNQTQADGVRFSTGHRHCLALAWQPTAKQFFMVMMGRDQMNTRSRPEYYDDLDNAYRVAEEMHLLRDGVNLGWPTTYWDPIKKARMVGPEYGGDNRKRDNNPLFDKPVVAFPAHWAPLQMCLYDGTQFPAHYRNGMFIAFHGSWNRAPRAQAGYKIAFVPFDDHGMPTGIYETFADGFAGVDYFTNTRDARFRPAAWPSPRRLALRQPKPRRAASGASFTPGKPRRSPERNRRPRCPWRRRQPDRAPIRPAEKSTSRSAPPATWPTAAASRACSPRSSAAPWPRVTRTV